MLHMLLREFVRSDRFAFFAKHMEVAEVLCGSCGAISFRFPLRVLELADPEQGSLLRNLAAALQLGDKTCCAIRSPHRPGRPCRINGSRGPCFCRHRWRLSLPVQ